LLRLIRRNVGTGFNASADCPGGRHDHASRRRLRPGEDDGQPCVRGKNHHTPDPQGRPQMRAMARRRLRSVPVNVTERASNSSQTGRRLLFLGPPPAVRVHAIEFKLGDATGMLGGAPFRVSAIASSPVS